MAGPATQPGEDDRAALCPRGSEEVLADHLRLRRSGDLEEDLRRNYDPQVVILTARQVFRGHDGVRGSAHRLWKALGDGGSYSYVYALADDRVALLEWSGSKESVRVRSGVDSHLIEEGCIRVQTIHYRVEDVVLSADGDLTDG
ncbi:nuclear transport factor 2 family protein [Blastococcus goldschmidtiae]|uniref:Nuclear transport factor 2 family protein n=1 Tax=Blastococcus goldschmidtiae TaxID=3075546 RepID=A0ABU2K7I2_9ACTN|nr:nuclear transport factor 2 family protein [Blastococcus sp. DSM 46792]MDT0276140.1 nuclear transport factor 2 family protein [Blastococcus sp. DSM 46792]